MSAQPASASRTCNARGIALRALVSVAAAACLLCGLAPEPATASDLEDCIDDCAADCEGDEDCIEECGEECSGGLISGAIDDGSDACQLVFDECTLRCGDESDDPEDLEHCLTLCIEGAGCEVDRGGS